MSTRTRAIARSGCATLMVTSWSSLDDETWGRPGMIRETATNLPPEWGELVDVDVLDSGHWAGLFRLDADLFVRTAHACRVVPGPVRFPLIRCLDEERVV